MAPPGFQDDAVGRPVPHLPSQQTQRLENLGILVGGIAHDLNNVLAVITSFGAFVGEEITQARDDGCDYLGTAGEDIEKVLRAARRGAGLTEQLCAFGHREVMRAEVLNVDSVIHRVADLLTPAVSEHIRVALDLVADPYPILADPGQLARALLNLAANACDAMPDGGTLSIDTAHARAGVGGGPRLRIRVRDTGHGIPAEIIDRIFEPFFTTKDDCAGCGLGLATVHSIVTQAGGTVEVHARASAGTVFTMLFPVADDRPGEPS